MQKVGGKWYGFNRGLSTLFAEVENRRGRARRALSPPAHHAWAEFGGCGVEKPHCENVRLLSPQTFALSLSFHGVSRPETAGTGAALNRAKRCPAARPPHVPPLAPPSAHESLALSHAGPRGGDAQQLSGQ